MTPFSTGMWPSNSSLNIFSTILTKKRVFCRKQRLPRSSTIQIFAVYIPWANSKGAGSSIWSWWIGETLGARIRRSPLPVRDALAYAIQIGDALQEAHSKGITHRDVKADNVMIDSRNQVKVTDFGLAKLKGSLKLAQSSTTVGTMAYMSPEQIQGGDADGRSDLFSLGVLLFQMVTGQLPFRGEHRSRAHVLDRK